MIHGGADTAVLPHDGAGVIPQVDLQPVSIVRRLLYANKYTQPSESQKDYFALKYLLRTAIETKKYNNTINDKIIKNNTKNKIINKILIK